MTPKEHQSCPICHADVMFLPRYPRYLCASCSGKVTDENGRPLEFSNVSFSGGCVARYADTGEPRQGGICFVDGVKCHADEARFGGIVIQATDVSR